MSRKKKEAPCVLPGEPVIFETDRVCWWACCDCNLVHVVVMTILDDHRVSVRMYRDNYQTDKDRKLYKKGGSK